MKISPLAPGTGVTGDASLGQTASPSKLIRAKAIAEGRNPDELQSTGDPQADKARNSIKKIKMRTQVSTNRDDVTSLPSLETETIPLEASPEAQITTPDTNEPAPVVEETKPLSPQFAALAKTKRALQVKERELAQREEALKTQSPAGNEGLLTRLKADPLNVLQEAGVTYDQLTEAILNNQSASTIDPIKLRNEIKEELKKELFGEFSTRDQQAEQQVLTDMRREVLGLISENENFEAIRAAKADKDVVELIHRNWKATGEIMGIEEAANLVENQLIEEALPFAKIKKVQSRLTPVQEAQIVPPPQRNNVKVMRTLTNRDSASPIIDKRARAIAAMNGTLRKG